MINVFTLHGSYKMAILEVCWIVGLLLLVMKCLGQIVPDELRKSDRLLLTIISALVGLWIVNTTMVLYMSHYNSYHLDTSAQIEEESTNVEY
jgi:uncharacterized BrkB/YihY/UPF0761 family membrane protein